MTSTPDPVSGRRRQVALAGHLGNRATAEAALDDTDDSIRELAIGALERLGALDDDQLVSLANDPSIRVRRRVAELLASHTAVDPGRSLHDDDPTVVEVAAWAMGERENVEDSVLERLIELAVEARDPLVRESAAAALGAIGDPRGLPAILTACDDKPAVRRRAVLALAPFDGPEVEAAIDRALEDRDWQVRQSAEDLRRFDGLADR
ncbi:MAG: HEAT repeat domain-containing protein [Ilumatobacteraceae bacterium]|jgi:HEAT repeat protein